LEEPREKAATLKNHRDSVKQKRNLRFFFRTYFSVLSAPHLTLRMVLIALPESLLVLFLKEYSFRSHSIFKEVVLRPSPLRLVAEEKEMDVHSFPHDIPGWL
jgi:hypothetical protein